MGFSSGSAGKSNTETQRAYGFFAFLAFKVQMQDGQDSGWMFKMGVRVRDIGGNRSWLWINALDSGVRRNGCWGREWFHV